MDQVEFEPAQHWTASILKAEDYISDSSAQARQLNKIFPLLFSSTLTQLCHNHCFFFPYLNTIRLSCLFFHLFCYYLCSEKFKLPLLIRAGGGIFNYLYQLKQSSREEGGQIKVGGSNILGKLQITWRTNLGEPGRLQTQQIIGTVSRQDFLVSCFKML